MKNINFDDIKIICINRPNAVADFNGNVGVYDIHDNYTILDASYSDWNKYVPILDKFKIGDSYLFGIGYLDDFKDIDNTWVLKNCGFDILLINKKNCNYRLFKDNFYKTKQCKDWKKYLL